jgi:hypothetical protein
MNKWVRNSKHSGLPLFLLYGIIESRQQKLSKEGNMMNPEHLKGILWLADLQDDFILLDYKKFKDKNQIGLNYIGFLEPAAASPGDLRSMFLGFAKRLQKWLLDD